MTCHVPQIECGRAGIQAQGYQSPPPSLFTVSFTASTFWANPSAAQRAALRVGRIPAGVPTSQVGAAARRCSGWLSRSGRCSVARLQCRGKKTNTPLMNTGLKSSWESVLLCGNGGRGVFGGTSKVLPDDEPAERSNCLRGIHGVSLA